MTEEHYRFLHREKTRNKKNVDEIRVECRHKQNTTFYAFLNSIEQKKQI